MTRGLVLKLGAATLAASAALIAAPAAAHADDTKSATLTCTTGDTAVSVSFRYADSGYSVSYWDVKWSTSPGTKLDRLQLAQSPAGGKDAWVRWWWKGGKASTTGDVPASGGKAGFVNNVMSGHDVDASVRLNVWGDGDSCRRTKALS